MKAVIKGLKSCVTSFARFETFLYLVDPSHTSSNDHGHEDEQRQILIGSSVQGIAGWDVQCDPAAATSSNLLMQCNRASILSLDQINLSYNTSPN